MENQEENKPAIENFSPLESNETIQHADATPPSDDTVLQEDTLSPELLLFKTKTDQLKEEIGKIIVGQESLVELLLVALISGGHCLVEGVPGIAKTLTSKLLARSLAVDFSRIQFTPDLMPSDVLGTNIFNVKESEFRFNKGPIFSNIVLIDEINRAPAKTQSALFEVMEEQQISIDGTTYPMSFPFFVVATQNPLEQEGTYRLPEAQLDRFIFRILMDYPSVEEEFSILQKFQADNAMNDVNQIQPILTANDLKKLQAIAVHTHVSEELLHYISKISAATRQNPDLFLGASPRASINMLRTSKALAALRGRTFVTPDDVKDVVFPILNHRVILSPDREMEGYTIAQVIADSIAKIEVPR
ncbi:MAG: MoxR family ATPase [Schleiferiaceae bacterium]|nr:MoxR family ATPase [Schleiferiaceae bacterium]